MKLAVVAAFVAACDRPTARPPPLPEPFLEPPREWITSVDESEKLAFAIQSQVGGGFCKQVEAGQVDALAPLMTASFRGLAPEPKPVDPRGEPVVIASGTEASTELDAAAFVAHLRARLLPVAVVERCLFKPYQIFVAPSRKEAFGRFDVAIAGRSNAGAPVSIDASADARVTLDSAWKLDRIRFGAWTEVEYAGARFTDVSAHAGVDFYRSKEKEAAMFEDLGNINVMSIGGITVLDADGDRFSDLLVYNAKSLFHLFLNDGQGGFSRAPETSLIPAREAAFHYVSIDLDGDGADELVGTMPQRCGEQGARIPIHRFAGGRLTDTKGGLPGPFSCDDFYSHVAAADYDGDGLIDLFLSNYGGRRSNAATNQFDATDGGQDRLYRNLGSLSFSDVTHSAGIGDESRRTWLAHWFDYDQDGRIDLLALNDFGPNIYYANAGSGVLERRSMPPLTDRAFSMGISIADYDNDADLDLYLSKMFSYAGQRILAISTDVTGERLQELRQMAIGNSLYQSDGAGRYVDRAGPLGVDNAQWAWGSTFFDADNDGDRDLFVTNGLATNPDPAAKDAPDN